MRRQSQLSRPVADGPAAGPGGQPLPRQPYFFLYCRASASPIGTLSWFTAAPGRLGRLRPRQQPSATDTADVYAEGRAVKNAIAPSGLFANAVKLLLKAAYSEIRRRSGASSATSRRNLADCAPAGRFDSGIAGASVTTNPTSPTSQHAQTIKSHAFLQSVISSFACLNILSQDRADRYAP